MNFGTVVYFLGYVHGDMKVLNCFIELKVRENQQMCHVAEKIAKVGEDLHGVILQCGIFSSRENFNLRESC